MVENAFESINMLEYMKISDKYIERTYMNISYCLLAHKSGDKQRIEN